MSTLADNRVGTAPPSTVLRFWLGYCAFVVYGSLVPLEFKPLALSEAWRTFQHMPVLVIGAEHRADWISNIVLYVPVGFLSAHGLLRAWRRLPRWSLLLLATSFSVLLAVAVEFAQIFFPPRTVALNDVFAETVGSLVGVVLAARYSRWFDATLSASPSATRLIDNRWLALYGLCYVALSLFPYDFVLSSSELQGKMESGSFGWLFAATSQGPAIAAIKLIMEIVFTIPIGWWLADRTQGRISIRRSAAFGALLGVAIELAQFFMLSGISQGISVLTRLAGVASGAALWTRRSRWTLTSVAQLLRRHTPWLGVLYAFALLETNHAFSSEWQGWASGLETLHGLRFLPFYYHYYTTELQALVSLCAVCLMYAPIGLAVWAAKRSRLTAICLAVVVSTAIETCKPFLVRAHPDPTNVLIAGAAAWAIHRLLSTLETGARTPMGLESAPKLVRYDTSKDILGNDASAHRASSVRRNTVGWVLWLVAMMVAAWEIATFPTLPGLLAALLVAAAVAVWRSPALIFLIVPAALPILDLTPWSGRIYIDEFDLLLLVTLATAYLRAPAPISGQWMRDRVLAVVTVMLGVALAIGVSRGMLPWQGIEDSAVETLHGPLNAIRIGKGALWALLICRLWRPLQASGADVERSLALGVVAGLVMTVLVIVWERSAFASLMDFAGDYRVTGPFSAMHTGGAYIECFLVVASPFLIVRILESRDRLNKIAGVILLAATTYSVMVTFSRTGQAALAVTTAIVLVASLAHRHARGRGRAWAAVWLAALVLAAATPVLRGPFALARTAAVSDDFSARLHHWSDTIAMRPNDWATALFGAGLGRFPETHYWHHDAETRSGTFHLRRDELGPFLRLGSGSPIYLEQFVTLAPDRDYTLQLKIRAHSPDAWITISLCEKWLLASINCVESEAKAGPTPDLWQSVEIRFKSGRLGSSPWFETRPIKLALHNPEQALWFDVADLRLQEIGGRPLLCNGDFSQGMDHWFFSSDKHLPWHVKSLPIGVWFDLGWLGVAAFALAFGVACVRGARAACRGNMHAAAALAALVGFAMLGVFDTLIDTPRFLLVFLALCALSAAPLGPERETNSNE